MSSTKEIQEKKLNARLYPIYKMVSWDLLFYYSIIYLFLTQAKNFSASQVLLGEAFFTVSCLVLQIPIGLLIDKIGKRSSLVLANICMCVFTFVLMITTSYSQLLFAYFIDAIGYVIKGICETNILYDALPKGKKRGKLYSMLDGLGASRYYVVDAITSLVAGFAFVINPYFLIILCFIGNVIATILSTRFRKIESKEKEKSVGTREYFKQLKSAGKFAIKSKRMMCLLIFFGLVSGLIYNMTTLRSGVLAQINLPEQYFGIVFAILQIAASICSRAQNIIQKRYKNNTLAYLGIPLTVSCIIIGLLSKGNQSLFKVFIIITLFVIQGAIKGVYNVLIYRYLNNFTTKNIRTKLATIRSLVYNVFTIIISLFGSLLLSVTDASNTILLIGCMSTIVIILLLDYMRDKVGLKPNKYSNEDLKYYKVKQ